MLLLAGVVHGPEDPWLALRAGQSAGLINFRVLEAARDLEKQRCRLLRVGAAGQQQ